MSVKSAEYANQFIGLFNQAASTANEEKKALEKEIAKLESNRDQFDAQIASLENKLNGIDDDIALALKIAAKDAGMSLELSNGPNNGPNNGSIKRRTSSKDLKDLSVKVLNVLPTATGKFIVSKDIEVKVGLDTDKVRLALVKLKRSKQAVSNGKKGPVSGWRRV